MAKVNILDVPFVTHDLRTRFGGWLFCFKPAYGTPAFTACQRHLLPTCHRLRISGRGHEVVFKLLLYVIVNCFAVARCMPCESRYKLIQLFLISRGLRGFGRNFLSEMTWRRFVHLLIVGSLLQMTQDKEQQYFRHPLESRTLLWIHSYVDIFVAVKATQLRQPSDNCHKFV